MTARDLAAPVSSHVLSWSASRVPGFVQVLLNTKTFRVQWQLCQDLKGLRATNQSLISTANSAPIRNKTLETCQVSKKNIEETGKNIRLTLALQNGQCHCGGFNKSNGTVPNGSAAI